MDDLTKLYQETILDRHRAPRNAGRLPEPTHQAEAHNPLCGDRVVVTLLVGALPASGETGVLEARCEAQGCALCRASGSLATELLAARPASEAREHIEQFLALVSGVEGAPAHLSGVEPLLEVRKFPSRRRCVTLPWEVFRAALAR